MRSISDLESDGGREFTKTFIGLHGGQRQKAEFCWRRTVEIFLNSSSDVPKVSLGRRDDWAEEWALRTLGAAANFAPPFCAAPRPCQSDS